MQSFVNHIEIEDIAWLVKDGFDFLDWELDQAAEWERNLTEYFPQHCFVLDQATFDFVTWYQAFPDSPTDDDPHWYLCKSDIRLRFSDLVEFEAALEDLDLFKILTGSLEGDSDKACVKAQNRLIDWYSQFDRPEIHPRHRGAMVTHFKGNRQRVDFAGKTIRRVIGPKGAPELTDFRPLEPLPENPK